ncbi:hypothetical protein [Brucella sp. IR073]
MNAEVAERILQHLRAIRADIAAIRADMIVMRQQMAELNSDLERKRNA